MLKLKVVWSQKAKAQLKTIHDYYKSQKKTPQGAANLKQDILAAHRSVTYLEQYQKDEINPNYRRIIVWH